MVRRVRMSLPAEGPVCELPSPRPGIRCLVSLRSAGDMSLGQTARRRAFFEALSIPSERVLALRQVHSQRVLTAEEVRTSADGPPQADGLLARDAEAVLTVTVADCLPIFLADRAGAARALLHSGWRGTGIVAEAIRRMAELYGTRAADVAAVIGPGIGPCCYDVPRGRYDEFRERFGAEVGEERGGKTYLDLRAANLVLLARMGVEDVTVVDDCTACTPALASWRAALAAAGAAPSFVGMVAVMGSF